jgi:hypothetical protein
MIKGNFANNFKEVADLRFEPTMHLHYGQALIRVVHKLQFLNNNCLKIRKRVENVK